MKNRITTYGALIALSLLAAWPLLRYGPPLQAEAITDGPNHLYRFALLSWHVQHGDFYPRWFSDLHYGFGAPVLNFYAPLSYYILLGLRLLTPSFPTAFLLGFVLSIAVGIWGMYYWANEQFASPVAGLTAAAAYSLTPYTYFSIMDRAAYPEMWGLALAPWLFCLTLRLVRRPSHGTRIALTVLYGSLILTHNLSALLFTPILLVYSVVSWLQNKEKAAWHPLMWLSISLVHAVCITAFFLLPFLLESQYVQLQRTSVYSYAASFGAAKDLFSPPIPFDPRHVINPRPTSVPWPQLALALAAAATAAVWRKNRAVLPNIIIHGLFAALLIFMNLRTSLPLWNILPIANLIQFPFRLLGPAMLLMAWMAGAFIAQLSAPSIQRPFALAAIASFFFFTLTWTYHAPFDHFPDTIRPADIIRDEIAHPTRLGTTNLQEFLPRWVSELPSPDSTLPRYESADIPSRIAALPNSVALIEEHTTLTASKFIYDSPQPFTADFNIFYFPGWTATLDGNPIPIRPSPPHGVITLDLPAGRHEVQVARQPTSPQVAGSLISLIALLLLGLPLPAIRTAHPQSPAETLQPIFAVLLASLIVLRLAVLDQVETPFSRTQLHSIANPLSANFDNQLALIGLDYPDGARVTAGDSLRINLYWRALAPLTTDYHIGIQLVDQHGNRFGQSDNQNPASVPTSHWKPEQYARDEHQLQSLSGAPPGEYHLLVGVYALTDGGVKSLNVLADGSPTGLEYDLGVVTVTRAALQAPGPLRIAESSVAIQTVGVGDRLPFTIAFVSGDSVSPGLTAELQFIGSNGQPIFSTRFAPAGPDYPSEQWTPRELIRYPHSIDLPPDLPAGPVHLTLTFIHPDGSPASQSFELGAVTITVPERSFAIPPMSHHVDHDFGAAIRLLGYDLTPETVTLYWQSLQPVSTRLTVFVHNFDASGNFIGGQDSPPPRPTTSWLPGEVITDVRQFSVGEHFEIGLYDPVTADRFGKPFSNQP
ncbi:MAG TPA: 6-pyruvoyl-tetrahydropterin synthase-related protein [Anaerolineales bacterium]|nr:6-pyruvoyl-tetrahydropterin synthase-related protein [Anaerolineales bacterium]